MLIRLRRRGDCSLTSIATRLACTTNKNGNSRPLTVLSNASSLSRSSSHVTSSCSSSPALLPSPTFHRHFAYRPDPTPPEKLKAALEKPRVVDKVKLEQITSALRPQNVAASTSINDVLTSYQTDGKTFTCFASQTLYEAVQIMVASRVGCLVAMEDDGEHVAGLVTERDLLSEMVQLEANSDSASSNWRTHSVAHAMTPSREMVHIKPSDSIEDALTLMTSQGFRHLPVLDSLPENTNVLRGIVSMRNLVDIVYKNRSAGSKGQFLTDVLPRTGVPRNTSLRKKKVEGGENLATQPQKYRSLYLNAGVSSIPHPDKKNGEDAFVSFLGNVGSNSKHEPLSVIAVFDGVGSWSFEQGIDPSKFSNECARALKQYVDTHPAFGDSRSNNKPEDQAAPISPSAMMNAAWKSVTQAKIVGSSTACILALAHESNELRAANIGDSGFLILRHKDSRVRVGSVGAMTLPTDSNYQVIFRSPQQLHYFNCPLQLGQSVSGEADKFESPADADLLSHPVQEGDLIVLSTDGLFDNVPEESILNELSAAMENVKADQQHSNYNTLTPFSITNATPPSPAAKSAMKPVADALVKLAHTLSIDRTIDSPFAVLAKENNILWKNGGRKDDITVIVARVEAIPLPTDKQ